MDDDLKKNILKTGTTILGIVCKDGVVMASDKQVTLGQSIVSNKNFDKTIPINDYLTVSICGGVSDAQRYLKLLTAELKLKELRSKKRPTVKESANLMASIAFSQIRQPSMIPAMVGLLVGGFDEDGKTELYSIMPDGSINLVDDYDVSIGSGMAFSMGLLERQYKPGLSIKEGIELAKEALKSSTQRDVGSGYGMDVYTITKEGIDKVISQVIEPNYKNK